MEQSLVPTPVPMTKLLIAPENAPISLSTLLVCKNKVLTLKNNAKAPYPGGKGGLNQIMQVRVNVPLNGTDTTTPAAQLALPQVSPLTATVMREIVMKEDVDPVTGLPIDMKLNGKWFDDPVEETQQQDQQRFGNSSI